MAQSPSYNSELTSLPIVMSFAHAKAPPTWRCDAKHGNDVSSSFVMRNHLYFKGEFNWNIHIVTKSFKR